MTYNRKAVSISEQISILESRNLIVNDKEFAENILAEIGYFRFKGYCLPYYQDKDYFIEGTTIEVVYYNYRFDERFRMLLFQMIEHIEVAIKSKIGYHFALEHDPLGFYKNENFFNEKYHESWLEDFNKAISQASKRRELYTEHYIKHYSRTFPVWVALEMSSFGSVSKFYNNINRSLQNKISKDVTGLNSVYLRNWLYVLSVVRNTCAHTSRMYDRVLPIKAKIEPKMNDEISNERAFTAVYIAKKICVNDSYWMKFENNLAELLRIYSDYIDFEKIGFNENWQETLNQ